MEPDADGRTPGGVPNAYRNAVFWRWAPSMPKALPVGFVAVLYAMGSASNPAGQVRFRGGKAIRISDIARGAGVDEKSARRFIEAGIAAGVLAVEGERKRGRATLYVLVLSPFPDWGAAESVIKATRRVRKEDRPPPWSVEPDDPGLPSDDGDLKFGTPYPEHSEWADDPEFGTRDPELSEDEPEEVRDAVPRMSSGRRTPNGSGRSVPNIPCMSKGGTNEMAEVVPQPQVGVGSGGAKIIANQEQDGWGSAAVRCGVCHKPMVQRHGRTAHAACEIPVRNPAQRMQEEQL